MQDITHILADLTEVDGQPMTDSLKVAARFGKRHDNALKAIRAISAAQPDFAALHFEGSEFKDKNGRARPMFRMTKNGFSMLAMGFTGAAAMQWKVMYITAFDQMAEQIAIASSVPAMPVTLHERIVAWEQLVSATYAAAKGGSADMNKRKRALKVLRPEAVLIPQEQQPDLFALKG